MSVITDLDSVQVNLDLSITPTALIDINTYWLNQLLGKPSVLLADITNSATTLTVDVLQSTQNQSSFGSVSTPAIIAVGAEIVIDGEAMAVTAITALDPGPGFTVTVSRGTTQTTPLGSVSFPLVVAAAHTANTAVGVLSYKSPWELIRAQALVPWCQSVIASLGNTSSTFLSSATGTITLPS